MDVNDYKNYFFGFIFYKYLFDKLFLVVCDNLEEYFNIFIDI